MKIGIIGTGHMARGIGPFWATVGHQVMYGSRDVDRAKQLAEDIGISVFAGSYQETLDFGDVVFLALPGKYAVDVLKSVQMPEKRILIDCMNPLFMSLDGYESLAEMVAEAVPGARVIKAFNSIAWYNLPKPSYEQVSASLFYCGDDPEAKTIVRDLGREIGYEPLDIGDLSGAKYMESIALLFRKIAYSGKGADIAFKFLDGQPDYSKSGKLSLRGQADEF